MDRISRDNFSVSLNVGGGSIYEGTGTCRVQSNGYARLYVRFNQSWVPSFSGEIDGDRLYGQQQGGGNCSYSGDRLN